MGSESNDKQWDERVDSARLYAASLIKIIRQEMKNNFSFQEIVEMSEYKQNVKDLNTTFKALALGTAFLGYGYGIIPDKWCDRLPCELNWFSKLYPEGSHTIQMFQPLLEIEAYLYRSKIDQTIDKTEILKVGSNANDYAHLGEFINYLLHLVETGEAERQVQHAQVLIRIIPTHLAELYPGQPEIQHEIKNEYISLLQELSDRNIEKYRTVARKHTTLEVTEGFAGAKVQDTKCTMKVRKPINNPQQKVSSNITLHLGG